MKISLKLFAVALLSTTLMAAPNRNVVTVNTAPPTHSRASLDFMGGFATTANDYAGSFLVGTGIQIERTSSTRIGLASGVLFGSGTGLPILLSIVAPFTSGSTRMYLGGAVGPVIGISGNGVFNDKSESVKLALLLRPGIVFEASQNLDVTAEMMTGALTGIFYISPMLGLSLKL